MPEQLLPGLMRDTRHDGRILIYTLTNMAQPVIDAWFEDYQQHLLRAKDVMLMACDLSDKSLTLTPYIRTRTIQLTQLRPELQGRVAVIVARNLTGQLLKTFMWLLNSTRGNRQRRVFFTQAEAVQWLEECL